VKVGGQTLTIHDLKLHGNLNPERDSAIRLFEEAFLAVWRAHAESDGFNRLTLYGELPWRDVSVLRAVAKFLRQAAFPFSQALIEEALTRNPRGRLGLVRLFKARFDPTAEKRDEAEKQVTAEIDDALAKVPSLDDDRTSGALRNRIIDAAHELCRRQPMAAVVVEARHLWRARRRFRR